MDPKDEGGWKGLILALNPHTNIEKSSCFLICGSARTPKAYWYVVKAMHSPGLFGPALFQGTSQQFVLANSSSNTSSLWESSD